MGEALFKIAARFPTADAAEAARVRLDALLAEDAEGWWQDRRHVVGADFWPEFRRLHPLSCEVLAQARRRDWKLDVDVPILGGEWNEGPCGMIDWCDNVWGETPRELHRPIARGRWLTYRAVTWYWAIWEPLARWLVSLGASTARWTNPQGTFQAKAEPGGVRVYRIERGPAEMRTAAASPLGRLPARR